MANSSVRLVLIHTGRTLKGAYSQFQYADLMEMDKASGFILNPCTEYGVYGDNYEKHYPYLVSQIDQLPPKPFYVGLPPVDISHEYTSRNCEHDYVLLTSFITRVFEEVKNLGKENRFKGFYFTTERIPGTVDVSAPTANPMVKLMSDLSNLIRKTHGKSFFWAPYLGYNDMYYTINENIGIIANRTRIFSTIFLQSGYYFKDDPNRGNIPKQNLALAVKSARNNSMFNFKSPDSFTVSATPVAEKKTSATVIGIDIEVEDSLYWELVDKSLTAEERTFKKNYRTSCSNFSSLFTSAACPFLFYAGSYNGIVNCNLHETINAFYDNGACKLPTIKPEHLQL